MGPFSVARPTAEPSLLLPLAVPGVPHLLVALVSTNRQAWLHTALAAMATSPRPAPNAHRTGT